MSFQPAIFNQTYQAEAIRETVRQFIKWIEMKREYDAMVNQLKMARMESLDHLEK